MCKTCGLKQAQYPRWLCRRCDKAAGTYVPRPPTERHYQTDRQEVTLRRLLAAVDAERQRLAVLRAAAAAPVRERVIGGRAYWIIWDGTRASPSLTGWPSREW